MPIDVNGYAVSNSGGGLKFGASNSMIVAADYGIRDPMLPGMRGQANTGVGNVAVYPFPVNEANVNIGSPWSTSTYMFTAPVDGIYFVSYGGIVGIGSYAASYAYYGVIVNGVNVAFSYENVDNNWTLHHMDVLLLLVAGDTVAWSSNAAPGAASTTGAGMYQANHNDCTIWLVG